MSRSFFLPVHWVFSIKTGRDCFSPSIPIKAAADFKDMSVKTRKKEKAKPHTLLQS